MTRAAALRWSVPAILLLGGCISGTRPAPAAPDAAVYAAVLERLAAPGKAIVLVDTTVTLTDHTLRYPVPRDIPDGDTVLYAASRAASYPPRPVPRPLPTQREVRFIRQGDVPFGYGRDSIEGWEEFHARNPDAGGIFSVSGIGYDRGRTRAMLYVSHHCYGRCATGWLVLLTRGAGGWAVVVTDVLWIS